ncbi:hypothetical protein L9F63_011684, partial [Diploptera punctata]
VVHSSSVVDFRIVLRIQVAETAVKMAGIIKEDEIQVCDKESEIVFFDRDDICSTLEVKMASLHKESGQSGCQISQVKGHVARNNKMESFIINTIDSDSEGSEIDIGVQPLDD